VWRGGCGSGGWGTAPPRGGGGDESHEGSANATLAGAGCGDRDRRRLRALRRRCSGAEKSGPAERAAGLLAEPRRAGEDPSGGAGAAREGQDGDLHRRCVRAARRHRNALQAARRFLRAGNGDAHRQDRQIRRIEAKGNVVVTQKDQNATGDAATFNMRENTVTLVGNVVVTRGADVLRGQRLVVDLTSGVSKMDQGRVEGLFQSGPRNP